MSRSAWVEINTSALRHNLKRVRELAPRSRVVAIIKANGYGHGIERVARVLRGTDAFGVASIDEAQQLRASGVTQPIVVLGGIYAGDELRIARREALDIVVHSSEQTELLRAATADGDAPVRVWIKLDTGMHRLGFAPLDAHAAIRCAHDCAAVTRNPVLMSHLACADEPASPVTEQQRVQFEAFTSGYPFERSLANSAAILAWPQTHYDWVRPGIMLYGITPFADRTGTQEGLTPVMTARSNLIAVKRLARGDAVGYGSSWTCPEDMPVGVIAFGYGDGYPRHAPPGTPVLVNGTRVPLIGRVSMDMITVDLRTQPGVRVGDAVVLWGQGLPVEEIARAAQTIPYELVCGITPRVRVVEVQEPT